MPITVAHVEESTTVVILVLIALFVLSLRKSKRKDLLPMAVSQELKGFSILAIVFAHISYMLVRDHDLLYPLNGGAGVGVDLFLFLSGYGLSVSMLKKPLTAVEFYKRRLIKVFIPFWIVLLGLFITDAVILDIHYTLPYMLQSFLGWFPRTLPYEDVNSPFWYITWMLLFYMLFPLLYSKDHLWLTAIALSVVANVITQFNPLRLETNWWQQMHTNAFSLGIVLAWLLLKTKTGNLRMVDQLVQIRDSGSVVGRYLIICALLLFAAYMASHGKPWDWPAINQLLQQVSLISEDHAIGQTTSLLAMLTLLVVFTMKKFESRLLYIFGVYSYETYLLHWPLMARYDAYFHALPAWGAVLLWLLTLLAIGWLLQQMTQAIGDWLDSRWDMA